AGQSESNAVRGYDDGMRAGAWRDRRRRLRRLAGQLRTERLQTRDHLQLSAFGHADCRRLPWLRRVHDQGHRNRSREGGLVRKELSDAGDGAGSESWLRQSGADRAHRTCRAQQLARGGVEAGLSYWRGIRSAGAAGEDDATVVWTRVYGLPT